MAGRSGVYRVAVRCVAGSGPPQHRKSGHEQPPARRAEGDALGGAASGRHPGAGAGRGRGGPDDRARTGALGRAAGAGARRRRRIRRRRVGSAVRGLGGGPAARPGAALSCTASSAARSAATRASSRSGRHRPRWSESPRSDSRCHQRRVRAVGPSIVPRPRRRRSRRRSGRWRGPSGRRAGRRAGRRTPTAGRRSRSHLLGRGPATGAADGSRAEGRRCRHGASAPPRGDAPFGRPRDTLWSPARRTAVLVRARTVIVRARLVAHGERTLGEKTDNGSLDSGRVPGCHSDVPPASGERTRAP